MQIVLSRGSDGDRVSMSTIDPTRALLALAGLPVRVAESRGHCQHSIHICILPGCRLPQRSVPRAKTRRFRHTNRAFLLARGKGGPVVPPGGRGHFGKVGSRRHCPVEGNRTGPRRRDRIVNLGSGRDCYLETKNLDGETNLNHCKALRATSSITSEEAVEKSSFILVPHQNLYPYSEVLRYTARQWGLSKGGGHVNELLRGYTVPNTAWVIGLVAFTGPDTKAHHPNNPRSPREPTLTSSSTLSFCSSSVRS